MRALATRKDSRGASVRSTIASVLQEIKLRHGYVTPNHIRARFGDYHNALSWLSRFLLDDERLAEECVIDVCTIATPATPEIPAFHEWLVYWAVRATFRAAYQRERKSIAELASIYEKEGPLDEECSPLQVAQFRQLVDDWEYVHSRLDVLCRFVLVMRGIAKDSFEVMAKELRISRTSVQRAYHIAIRALEGKPKEAPRSDLVTEAC